VTAAALAVIRPAALRHNLGEVRRRAPGCRVLAVIKANAYGHGLLEVAGILEGADAFAVARVEEAVQLRRAGINKRLVVLGGFLNREELDCAVRLDLDMVVHSPEQLALLEARPDVLPPALWLKVDSGMGRLGLRPALLADARERLLRLVPLNRLLMMSHLACADDPTDPATEAQLACFGELLGVWPGSVSLANSAAILGWPQTLCSGAGLHYGGENWVRPGLMLYGASPLAGIIGSALGLVPALSFESRLIALQEVSRGSRVGYAGSWTAQRDSLLGVAAAGYADGYPWQLPSGTPVLVDGRPARLIGRVSMDMISVDLTGLPVPSPGAPVVLWGGAPAPAVEEIAAAAGTIPYALLAGLNRRVAVRIDEEGVMLPERLASSA